MKQVSVCVFRFLLPLRSVPDNVQQHERREKPAVSLRSANVSICRPRGPGTCQRAALRRRIPSDDSGGNHLACFVSIPSNPAGPPCPGPPLLTLPPPGEYRPRYICPPEEKEAKEFVHTLYREVNWFILTHRGFKDPQVKLQMDEKQATVNKILHHKQRVQKNRSKQYIFFI